MAEWMLNTADEDEVGCVHSHFLDSGSFSVWSIAREYGKKNGTDEWAYYDTQEFYGYMDSYAAFVKKYAVAIDLYANVDAIPNPVISWRNLKYLEREHGLNPVPVLHHGTDMKWLRKHLDAGYKIIGLGGVAGRIAHKSSRGWVDEFFDILCDTPNRLPRAKIHGFGITSFYLLTRYPWYSVDSASWAKVAAYGNILVPHKRGGKYVFDRQPYMMRVSNDSPDRGSQGKHILTLSGAERAIVQGWLDHIGVPLGKWGKDGEVLEYGVVTRHCERKAANLLFFEALRKSLPDYPWPFKPRRKGFNLL